MGEHDRRASDRVAGSCRNGARRFDREVVNSSVSFAAAFDVTPFSGVWPLGDMAVLFSTSVASRSYVGSFSMCCVPRGRRRYVVTRTRGSVVKVSRVVEVMYRKLRDF